MRNITVALAQTSPILNDVARNLQAMEHAVEQACQRKHVDLLVFPELCTTGYDCGMRFAEFAQLKTGDVVEQVAGWASAYGVHIVFGMAERQKVESVIYSAALLVDPEGKVVGDYQKIHLRGEQRLVFRPGYRYVVAETELGRLGFLVGWDLAFPEAARSLALEGAELLCLCGSWQAPHAHEWRTLIAARAYENGVYLAACNRVGEEPSDTFIGESMIVGPRGEVAARLDADVAGIAVATIDLDRSRQVQEETQLLQARQPRSYRGVVKMY
jgi:predicted amidohydrolase